jgi:hypothetical protein
MGREMLFSVGISLVGLLYLGAIVWAAFDASSRGRSGCLVGLLVFVLGPLGLILYLLLRPEPE